jgi:hypothetical protein
VKKEANRESQFPKKREFSMKKRGTLETLRFQTIKLQENCSETKFSKIVFSISVYVMTIQKWR